jgi:hypothetical protein
VDLWLKTSFRDQISFLNICVSLHTKVSAAACIAEEQFLCAAKIEQGRILRLLLSSKEGQNLDPKNHEYNKEHQSAVFYCVNYIILKAQVRMRNFKDCHEMND